MKENEVIDRTDGKVGIKIGVNNKIEVESLNPLLKRIFDSKQELYEEINKETIKEKKSKRNRLMMFLMASAEDDIETMRSILKEDKSLINENYPENKNGVNALTYAICFKNTGILEELLEEYGADANVYDTIIYYTPIMWSVYLSQLDAIKILLRYNGDLRYSPKENKSQQNAISLLNHEDVEIYQFFKLHNLFLDPIHKVYDDLDFEEAKNESILSKSMNFLSIEKSNKDMVDKDVKKNFNVSFDSTFGHFNYEKSLVGQYLIFEEKDIPFLSEYLINFKKKSHKNKNNTVVVASVFFQLIRYSTLIKKDKILTELFFNYFKVSIKTETKTKSGVFNLPFEEKGEKNKKLSSNSNVEGSRDILLLSYWLSVTQFIHFYFCRSKIYHSFPNFLQEIIDLIQSLIIALSFSISHRMNLLVDDCILNYSNLVNLSKESYIKKKINNDKFSRKINTYDDVLRILYPPSELEMMKPSPLKYIHIIGALDYVLELYDINEIFKIQTFFKVFYYNNCIIFNKIIGQKKYCSRASAIQIRLNLSNIEDWLRSHNFQCKSIESITNTNDLLGSSNIILRNLVLNSSDPRNAKNPNYSIFYYNSLYFIGRTQYKPTFELLEWLQCVSSLNTKDSLMNTIQNFEYLNFAQMYKVMKKLYVHEECEPKFTKEMIEMVKNLYLKDDTMSNLPKSLHYLTSKKIALKEPNIYLNPNHVFPVSLPNINELNDSYGNIYSSKNNLKKRDFQPFISIDVIDDIETITSNNKNDKFFNYNQSNDNVFFNIEDDHKDENKMSPISSFGKKKTIDNLIFDEWYSTNIENNPW